LPSCDWSTFPLWVCGCYIVLGFCLLLALVCAFLAIGGDWAWSCTYWNWPTWIKATQFPRWTLALASQKNRRWHTIITIIDIPFSFLTNIPGMVSCDMGGYFRHFISCS